MTFPQLPMPAVPKLAQKNLAGGRVYLIEDGEHRGEALPSITRILGAAPKPWLDRWKANVGPEKAAQIVQTAALKGRELHELAEHYLANRSAEYQTALDSCSPATRTHLWSKLRPWLDAHITGIYAQEFDLCSFKLHAAGRTDVVGDVDGKLSIVDFKNSRYPKEPAHMDDYYLQGTFYACALYELTGMRAKQIVFPVVSPMELQIYTIPVTTHNIARLQEKIAYFYAQA